MTTISIVTPWLNAPELVAEYSKAMQHADQLIIVDNGSSKETQEELVTMLTLHPNGLYLRNDENRGYSAANNQGLAAVTSDVVMFVNSDVVGDPHWIDRLRYFLHPGALFGASLQMRHVDGIGAPYLEGWCIGGYKDEIVAFGCWNETDFPGLYYEDNDFCWRAIRHGLSLTHVRLPLQHLNNYTSQRTPGAYDKAQDNRLVFEQIVRRDRAA